MTRGKPDHSLKFIMHANLKEEELKRYYSLFEVMANE